MNAPATTPAGSAAGSAVVAMTDPQLVADPYAGYDRIREEGPVRRAIALDGNPVWLVTRQADVREVMADPRVRVDPTGIPGAAQDARASQLRQIGMPEDAIGYLTGSIIDHDGADHTRLRKLVSRAFTVRRVGELRPRVEEIAADLLDRLPDPAERSLSDRADDTDLLEQYTYPLPITVICELVGVPEADRPNWRRWGATLVSMNPEAVPAAATEMIAHCHELTDRRRAEPQDDLLSALVVATDEHGDRLTDVEIVTMLLTLVFAGHETTAHLLANSAYALMTSERPQLERLLADPSGWTTAVGELMRTSGPVQIARVRYAAEDLQIGGVTIPQGDAIQPVLVAANRDPRAYDDPTRLDVTRHPAGRGDGHVGFGHGPHYCLGAALARQEGEVGLRMLFERYPRISFAGEAPQWLPLPGVRRLTALPVRLG
ncbi:cytochrome P450 family protein [Pseudonocardia sp. CA-107938]|uniref:cytochrome P450 family protein n=1 Tax=Pseudonocardia sp. CA-107938 TaxID=3240021 RepID=UPI003D90D57B